MMPEINKDGEIYLEHMNRYFFASQFVKGKNVLDIACGTGYGSFHLSKAGAESVIGVDISEEAIDYCKEKYSSPNVKYLVGTVESIPLEDDSVDVVVSMETIEHVREPAQKRFMQEVKRVLRKGGLFIVSTPNNLIHPKGNPYHKKEFRPDEFEKFLKNYFSHSVAMYQDHIECNFIFSKDYINSEIISSDSKEIQLRKIGDMNYLDSEFVVAVCSNQKINKKKLEGYVTLFNKRTKFIYEEYAKEFNKLREAELADLLRIADDRGKEIGRLNNLIKLKDEKIRVEEKTIVREKKMFEMERSEIQKKDQEINSLDRTIQQKNQMIQQKDQAIQKRDQEIQKRDQAIQKKDQEIDFIKSSKFWKARKLYVRIKYFRPGNVAELLSRAMDVLKKDGARKFLWSLYKYILHGRGYFRKTEEKADKIGDDIFFSDYEIWIQKNEIWNEGEIEKEIGKFTYNPKISIVLPVLDADEIFLRKAIFSVIYQDYQNWELCVADNASTKKIIRKILQDFEKKDSRIKVLFLDKRKSFSAAMNEAAEMATGDFIAFLGQHDELSPAAFFENVKLLNIKSKFDLIYSDEDKVNESGTRYDYNFKPDWSPELLISKDYIGNFALIRKKLFDKIKGFREEFDGAHAYDFMLRLSEISSRIAHIPRILYHSIILPAPISELEKIRLVEMGKQALQEAFERRKIKGKAIVSDLAEKDHLGIYSIKFNPADFKEKVTIIIPTKDKINLLKKCIESIKKKTNYDNYNILVVDNNSEKKETFDFLKKEKINFVSIPTENFNYARIHNLVMKKVDTELVLFLNNDTEVISPDWLLNMVGTISLNEKIGVVGAKLIYGDKKVQHCGVIVGLSHLTADHANKLIDYKSPGYQGYNLAIRNYSAVTAACMLTKRSLFEKVKGFDEENLAVAFNDVDYCLKLIASGHRIVCNPNALLFHHESKSRGGSGHNLKEPKYFSEKWEKVTRKDPFYNINFSLEDGLFRLKKN